MTNQLIISNTSIRQDSIGRYSLNDLHKASGGKKRHQPSDWLRLEQTNELIEEILKPEITGIKNNKVENPTVEPVHVKKGRYGGTYVCKELVYSYAMWISAAFSLRVIRAYDAFVSSVLPQKSNFRQSTAKELIPLRQTAERLIAHGVGNIYPDIWKPLHKEFGIKHINELLPEQIPQAISFLDALEGEYLPKQELTHKISQFDEHLLLRNLTTAYKHIKGIRTLWMNTLSPAIMSLNPALDSEITGRLADAQGATYSTLSHVKSKTEIKLLY